MSENHNTKTTLGTPCAPAWSTQWIQKVEAAEAELGHRICGAVGLDGTPCPNSSEHSNGRCKYHGGCPNIGGQPGNTNTTKHGLYSRRLRTCGPHCPKRHSCPLYDQKLDEVPKQELPICPYEQQEYDNLTQALLPQGPMHSPLYEHMVHTTALLSVMSSRAAALLGMYTVVEVTKVRFENYTMDSNKVSCILSAFLRLSSEHTKAVRELTKLSNGDKKREGERSRRPVEKAQPEKPSKKGTRGSEGDRPSEASPRAETGLSPFLRPQSEELHAPADPQENHQHVEEEQTETKPPASHRGPKMFEYTHTTTAVKVKTNKKRRKKKRGKKTK